MRIISKYKDYYDHMSYLGIDSKYTYVRQSHKLEDYEIQDCKTELNMINRIIRRGSMLNRSFGLYRIPSIDGNSMYLEGAVQLLPKWVAFSGKLYIIYIYRKCLSGKFGSKRYHVEIITDFDQVLKRYNAIKSKQKTYRSAIDESLLWKIQGSELPIEFFQKFNSPIVSSIQSNIGNDHSDFDSIKTGIWTDPILKKTGFPNIVPADQAWQELTMYLGFLGMGEPNMIEVADKYKIQAHGYDKHSFRRDHHPNKPRKS